MSSPFDFHENYVFNTTLPIYRLSPLYQIATCCGSRGEPRPVDRQSGADRGQRMRNVGGGIPSSGRTLVLSNIHMKKRCSHFEKNSTEVPSHSQLETCQPW